MHSCLVLVRLDEGAEIRKKDIIILKDSEIFIVQAEHLWNELPDYIEI